MERFPPHDLESDNPSRISDSPFPKKVNKMSGGNGDARDEEEKKGKKIKCPHCGGEHETKEEVRRCRQKSEAKPEIDNSYIL